MTPETVIDILREALWIIVAGPWMLTQLLDHANRLITSIPYLIG